MIDTLHHLVTDLLTNLDTSIVGSLLLVVAGICTVVQTLDEIIHISSVHTETLYEILFQTLSLCHTDGITHRVNVVFKIGLGSAIAASSKHCSHNSHNG